MPNRASGPRKNLLLTLWLLLPFAVLAGIVAIIFASYGKQKMDARPVGQGAGETGGANALGELLAGNDPIEQERIARDLREGRLIDPLEWPHGISIRVVLEDTGVPVHHVWLWGGEGTPAPRDRVTTGFPAPATGDEVRSIDAEGSFALAAWPAEAIGRIFEQGRPGAGVYVSRSDRVTVRGRDLLDADGTRLRRIELAPVPADQTTPGEPIEILVTLGSRGGSP